MAIEYLTGLNAIVMKAIWNIEKKAGQSNNTGFGGRNKKEYRERIS